MKAKVFACLIRIETLIYRREVFAALSWLAVALALISVFGGSRLANRIMRRVARHPRSHVYRVARKDVVRRGVYCVHLSKLTERRSGPIR